MKRTLNKIIVLSAFLLLGISGINHEITPVYGADVTVKLVLGKDASLTGYTAVDDDTIFHENVVTFTAPSGSPLPTPTKTGTTFGSWIYAENSELVRVSLMPLSSGAIYFAYWLGDGSLAIGGTSSSSSSSETSSSATSVSTEIVTLYLNTGGSSLWNKDGALFYVYTFNNMTAGTWPGTAMTMLVADIFVVSVPAGFTNVIFARVNPDTGIAWNQTTNLTYTGQYNYFTITGHPNFSDGIWSNYEV